LDDSKLKKLLKILNRSEFLRLGKFLRSPFFNYTPTLIAFYELLKKQYPDFPNKKWHPEKFWKKIFPNKPFHQQKFWRLCSDLSLLVEKYLVQLELEKQENLAPKLLTQAYGQRNAYVLFDTATQKQISQLKALPYRDVEFFEELSQLHFDHFFHVQTPKHTTKDEALQELMDTLDKRFILSKLRLASEFKNRERILKKKYDLRFLNEVLGTAADGFMEDNPFFELYQLLFLLYDSEQPQQIFPALKTLFSQQIKNLRRLDQSLLLTQLINYTIRQINTGNATFYKESLDLYKLALDNDLVLENGQINEAVYGNIALLGCHAKDFEWTDSFIEGYAPHLEGNRREDARALSRGLWYFHQERFEEAYDLYIEHSFSHFYQPKARLQSIKTLYELYSIDHSYFDLINLEVKDTYKNIL